MVSNKPESEEILLKKLSLIKATPSRNSQKAARGREDFMNQVENLKIRKAVLAAKQTGYRKGLFGLRLSLAPITIAIALTLVLLLGGTWGTVYAAQDSLPGDFLYSAKLAGESLHLSFVGNPEAKIDLLASYADRRVEEAIELAAQGQSVPESLPNNVETQLDAIFELAAGLENTALTQALSGVQIHLRDQDRDMTQVMAGLPEGVDPQLIRLQAMLQACQQLAASGVEDPNVFRHQFRHQENKPVLTPTTPITSTITSTVTSTITTTITATPVITGTHIL
jgi:hypothetical protein